VKILDFGLAKARSHDSSLKTADSSPAAAAAVTSPATEAGIVLGTAAYMSPEQARGAPVDKRTDVWAFACVLFEMLAGRHLFGATATVSDAIAAVLKSEPDWRALPEETPAHIRALLKRCLEKDPRRRLRDIGDAGLLLGETSGMSSVPPPPAATLRLALPLASQAIARNASLFQSFAISSDATRFAYIGRDSTGSSLYLQDLAAGELKRLPETGDAYAPQFSPDGRAVGFTSGSGFKSFPLDSGLPREIARGAADVPHNNWAWSGSDHIIVTGSNGLWRVPVNGGPAEVLAKQGPGEAIVSSVAALPGGAYLVATRATVGTDDRSRVVVVVPGEPERLVIAEGAGSPTFVAGDAPGVGHVVYAAAGRLVAVPFDATRRMVKGAAVPIVENVAMRANLDFADYAVSSTGTLVFREAGLHELVSIERSNGAIRP
jgi:hypothetical protein